MRKLSAIAAVLALTFASAAMAGSIDLSFCISSQGGNSPSCSFTCPDTANPTIFLAPTDQNDFLDTAIDGLDDDSTSYNQGSLTLRMVVNTDGGDGCGFETVSSLGLDVNGTQTAGTTSVSAADLTIFNTAGETGATEAPWSGTNTAGTGGASPGALISDARAVAVPASSGDTLWNGYCPGTYTAARLDLTAGSTGGPLTDAMSTHDLHMAVGPLKITRVYEPSSTQGAAGEDVSFGYSGGSPEAGVSGSTVGATSTDADAVVYIGRKGDYTGTDPNTGDPTGVPDGAVGTDDISFFVANLGNAGTTFEVFAGDFVTTDPNTGDPVQTPDCAVGTDDIAPFLTALTE